MARPYLAGIHLVIIEIFTIEGPVFIAYQTIFGDDCRIKLHLDLHIFGYGQQGRTQLIHQHLTRLIERIYIGIMTIALIGKLLHQVIVIISLTET